MRIHQMEIAGPEARHDSATDLLVDKNQQSLKQFLFHAFRRPPLESKIARYQTFFVSHLTVGEFDETAFLTTCKAILCSPNFLYVETPADESESDQRLFKLASRLSYFLWNSMPDEQLLEAAAGGKLSEPETLVAQIRRMLQDPRAEAFIEHFIDSDFTFANRYLAAHYGLPTIIGDDFHCQSNRCAEGCSVTLVS